MDSVERIPRLFRAHFGREAYAGLRPSSGKENARAYLNFSLPERPSIRQALGLHFHFQEGRFLVSGDVMPDQSAFLKNLGAIPGIKIGTSEAGGERVHFEYSVEEPVLAKHFSLPARITPQTRQEMLQRLFGQLRVIYEIEAP